MCLFRGALYSRCLSWAACSIMAVRRALRSFHVSDISVYLWMSPAKPVGLPSSLGREML